jgi:signal transduction histidine kinase
MGRMTPRVWDWGVPTAIAAVVVLEVALVGPDGAAAAAVLGVLGCLALVPRRRWTVPSALVAGTLTLLTPWFGPALDDLAAPILIMALVAYSLARWLPGHRGLLVLGALVLILAGDYVFTDERDNDVTDVFFVASLLLPPYVLGRVTRRLAEQAAQLERQQELIREQAIRDERDRIARDLHDVIAHSVSAMVVQTAAAQDLLDIDRARAARVLADVASTGRQALAETGRLLHLIRDGADDLGLAPTPGLAELPALVDRFRSDGLQIDLDLDDPVPVLPAGVDVSAYRIVQEALTNALRYGTDRRVEVTVSCADDRLRIRAANASHGHTGEGSGLGLLGVAERVQVLGGHLSHGVANGRFELDATLPVGAA